MTKLQPIQPLFITAHYANDISKVAIQLVSDNYNKKSGVLFINAKNDEQAISAFLQEYKDSPETIQTEKISMLPHPMV